LVTTTKASSRRCSAALRERIVAVLDQPPVSILLHDTGSGLKVQVPRLLRDRDWEQIEVDPASLQQVQLTASPLLTVHVQDDDGQQHWCSWNAAELVVAIDQLHDTLQHDLLQQDALQQRGGSQALPAAPADQTPGLIGSLFANTLVPLRQGIDLLLHKPVDARGLAIRGVRPMDASHQATMQQLLAHDGITDAAIVTTADQRSITALAGPQAEAVAATLDNARAFEAIPRDPNGQPNIGAVFLAFGLGRTGNQIRQHLEWTITRCTESSASLRATVPSNYLFFEGHFATYPVLAGGVQLHEVVMASLGKLCPELPPLNKLDSIKFVARIGPGDTIDVLFERTEDHSKVEFEVLKQDVRCTHGRLQFTAAIPSLQQHQQSLHSQPGPTAS
jgi:hypothetical protein